MSAGRFSAVTPSTSRTHGTPRALATESERTSRQRNQNEQRRVALPCLDSGKVPLIDRCALSQLLAAHRRRVRTAAIDLSPPQECEEVMTMLEAMSIRQPR
jgi:hypothetical protein